VKKKKTENEYERFIALSDAAKDAEVKKYDRPSPAGRDGLVGRPLRKADVALHRKAAAVGRPKIGQGAKIVPVSIERSLLREADAFAKTHRLKRSQMVAKGLRLLMQRKAS
jgi:hypothetical protein